MAFTVGGFAFNQCNCNKILAVAYVLYALQMIGMPAAFMKHYFSEKSVDESPDMLKFFTMMYGILFITGGYISWTFCDGFGMSFYNLFGQCLFAVHFVALLFGNLYAEKLYADEKQMWQIQLGINIIFVAIAYSGYTDAVACGKKDSDKTHNEAETSHKVISGVALHQTNVNKFFGVCWGFYGIMMLAMTGCHPSCNVDSCQYDQGAYCWQCSCDIVVSDLDLDGYVKGVCGEEWCAKLRDGRDDCEAWMMSKDCR